MGTTETHNIFIPEFKRSTQYFQSLKVALFVPTVRNEGAGSCWDCPQTLVLPGTPIPTPLLLLGLEPTLRQTHTSASHSQGKKSQQIVSSAQMTMCKVTSIHVSCEFRTFIRNLGYRKSEAPCSSHPSGSCRLVLVSQDPLPPSSPPMAPPTPSPPRRPGFHLGPTTGEGSISRLQEGEPSSIGAPAVAVVTGR